MEAPFIIQWREKAVPVTRVKHGGTLVYRCEIGGEVVILSTGTSASGDRFWTFIPQGDPRAARELGKLIDDHFRPQQLKLL